MDISSHVNCGGLLPTTVKLCLVESSSSPSAGLHRPDKTMTSLTQPEEVALALIRGCTSPLPCDWPAARR